MLKEIFTPWTWKMAARDSRRQRKRLLLFSVSIMFGIAALVAVASLKDNLLKALDDQAKALVGSDVFLNCRNRPFSEDVEKLLEKTEAQVLREDAGWANLEVSPTLAVRVEARAVEPQFPWYGIVTTQPPDAWQRCLAGEGLVVAPAVLEQGAKVGDEVKLGMLKTQVLGSFVQAPAPASWTGAMGIVAPEAFLARSLWKNTRLGGSFFSATRAHLKFTSTETAEAWAGKNRDTIRRSNTELETSEKRRKTANEVLSHVYSFLSLLSFVALVLGGLGIGSAIHAHAQQRLPSVATLRCLGTTASQTFAIYLVQGLALGVIGSVGGVVLGVGLQLVMPQFVQQYVPFEFQVEIKPIAVVMALALGFLICASFALLPLLKVRKVSPLAAVRASFTDESPPRLWLSVLSIVLWSAFALLWYFHGRVNGQQRFLIGWIVLVWVGTGILLKSKDPLWWVITGVLIAALTGLAWYVSPEKNRLIGYKFVAGLAVSLLVLLAVARLLMFTLKHLLGRRWPFAVRQGFSNLHRPRNQTTLFLVAGGLAVSMVLNMVLVQRFLLNFLENKTLKDKPNLVVLEVKNDTKAGIITNVQNAGASQVEYSPMVMMNLTKLGNTPLGDFLGKSERKVEGWMVRNNFRSTFRNTLGKGEALVSGELPQTWSGSGPVPISVEKGLGEKLGLNLGDLLTFRVGQEDVECRLAGVRSIQWEELGLNFFFVFPPGVFEQKPHTGVLMAKVAPEKVPGLQRTILAENPGSQVLDLGEVFATLSNIVEKVAFIIRFMASFSVATGIIILIAVLLIGKNDRVRESVLLRTLGADTGLIRRVLVSEYALLGFLSALTGSFIATIGSAYLAATEFKVPAETWYVPSIIAVGSVTLFSLLIGLFLGRGVASSPPLEILRETSI